VDNKLIQYCDERISSLKTEYDEFVPQWRELAQELAPTRGRFLQEKRVLGQKKYTKILNNTAGRALRDASAGIFAGTVNPYTKWFSFETSNPELMRIGAVRRWIHAAEEIVRAVLRDSNFYTEYPTSLSELLLFGTSALTQLSDFETVTRFYCHTIGTYHIGTNNYGDVDTFAVIKRMTARQLKQEFGEENLPKALLADPIQKSNAVHEVVQLVEPNPQADPRKLDAKFKPFRSIHYMRGHQHILRESGFDRFPTYVLRWATADEYAFGMDSPGMVALSDVKSLQQREKDKAKAIDRHVRPKLKGPTALAGMKLNDKEGDLVLYDSENSREGLSPIYQVDPRIQEMRQDIEGIEQAVKQAFFVDLFRAISSMQGVQPRNQLELSQRNAEALLLLGPVLQRVQRELLSRVVANTFAICMEADPAIMPEMPAELEGGALNIQFISSLAQAQRAQDLSALTDFAAFSSQVAAASPSAAAKIDTDAVLDLFGTLRGVNPMVMRDQEEVGQIRQAEAQAMQQQQALQAETQMASANVQNATAEKARADI
jgi:hypothetical protein